jgi:hypothetical protein
MRFARLAAPERRAVRRGSLDAARQTRSHPAREAERLRLASEPREPLRVVREGRGKDVDGDVSPFTLSLAAMILPGLARRLKALRRRLLEAAAHDPIEDGRGLERRNVVVDHRVQDTLERAIVFGRK